MSEESNGTGQLPAEPGTNRQCTFDTAAARATADGWRYQHTLALSDLVVAACDEIDRLRTEISRLTSIGLFPTSFSRGEELESLGFMTHDESMSLRAAIDRSATALADAWVELRKNCLHELRTNEGPTKNKCIVCLQILVPGTREVLVDCEHPAEARVVREYSRTDTIGNWKSYSGLRCTRCYRVHEGLKLDGKESWFYP